MTVRVKDILNSLNNEAPFDLAEPWDNVGLLVGNPEQKVTAILAGLDPTNTLIDEAIAKGVNTVVTHHPVIFKPLSIINTGDPAGQLLEKTLSNQISIIGCHTNFDSATEGVSDVLATSLGLGNITPLLPVPDGASSQTGLGRIGTFPSPVTSAVFITAVLKALDMKSIQVAGTLPEKIQTVAVCGGSGSDLAPKARDAGADVYLSAEIKHSTAIWAIENNFCIIDGTHYATEKPAITLLVDLLRKTAAQKNWNITISQTETEQHPFVLIDNTKS